MPHFTLNDPVTRASLRSSFGWGSRIQRYSHERGKKAAPRNSISGTLRKSTFVLPVDQRDIARGSCEFGLPGSFYPYPFRVYLHGKGIPYSFRFLNRWFYFLSCRMAIVNIPGRTPSRNLEFFSWILEQSYILGPCYQSNIIRDL